MSLHNDHSVGTFESMILQLWWYFKHVLVTTFFWKQMRNFIAQKNCATLMGKDPRVRHGLRLVTILSTTILSILNWRRFLGFINICVLCCCVVWMKICALSTSNSLWMLGWHIQVCHPLESLILPKILFGVIYRLLKFHKIKSLLDCKVNGYTCLQTIIRKG